jgi:pseudaminic acid cytidylyltransferase
MSQVAIIPARGGSKRIPHKNIKPFLGAPMLHWPIAAARAAQVFDRIIVSADDAEIADCARAAGVEALLRPDDLADDFTGVVPVIRHALGTLPDATCACLIYATAPFLLADDLRAGQAALKGASFALSVTTFPFPIQRAVMKTPDGRLIMAQPEHAQTRSQDLPEALHDAAMFAFGTRAAWFSEVPLFGRQTAPVEIPRHRVQDLDTPEDWIRAEYMGQALIAAGEISPP